MKKFQPTLEHALYALALLIAVGLRFLHLGGLPLSDYEAGWALQALRITQGFKPAVGPNTAYVHLTSILFSIFKGTDFLARFWPALAGTALVLAPWFLRRRLGRLAALVLAFGLALDPGLVAISHLAGGPMLAIVFLVFSALLWSERRFALAAFFAGLALLSGQSMWFGLLGIVFAWAFASMAFKKPAAAEKVDPAAEPVAVFPSLSPAELRRVAYWGIGTFLVAGSLLLLSPKGLSGFFNSFIVFARGWWQLSDVPLWQPALVLPAYEIFPLAFGIAGAVRGILRKDKLSIALSIWALVAILLALIYPGKQVSDMAWAVLPLWMLAALELSHHFDFEGRSLWEFSGALVVVIALLVFGWLNTASLSNMDLTTSLAHTRIWLLVAVLFLIVLTLLLVWTGWSAAVARLSGVWAAVLFLGLFTVALSTGTSGLRQPLTVDLWDPEPRPGRADIIMKVANQISDLNRGAPAQLPLTILQLGSPSLHWWFRDWQVQDVSELAADTTPEMIITPPGDVTLSVDYRGEQLVLAEIPDWSNATSSIWLKWVVYREMPMLREEMDLWVRSDLMLDSASQPSTTP